MRILSDVAVFPPGSLPQSPGADTRALFFRISGIYKESEKDTAMVAGALYELRDIRIDTTIDGGGGSALSKFENRKNDKSSKAMMYMPDPPPGFEFRLITQAGHEIHLDCEYIAGRYYQLPARWRTREAVDRLLKECMDDPQGEDGRQITEELSADRRALALAGVVPAHSLYMKVRRRRLFGCMRREVLTFKFASPLVQCSTWVVGRHETIVEAETKSQVYPVPVFVFALWSLLANIAPVFARRRRCAGSLTLLPHQRRAETASRAERSSTAQTRSAYFCSGEGYPVLRNEVFVYTMYSYLISLPFRPSFVQLPSPLAPAPSLLDIEV